MKMIIMEFILLTDRFLGTAMKLVFQWFFNWIGRLNNLIVFLLILINNSHFLWVLFLRLVLCSNRLPHLFRILLLGVCDFSLKNHQKWIIYHKCHGIIWQGRLDNLVAFRIVIALNILISFLRLRILSLLEVSFIRYELIRNLLFEEFGRHGWMSLFHKFGNRELNWE